jgi:DNA-binding GntR family transcriptional regulator
LADESVCLPERGFPDLLSRSSIPNDLEEIAQDSGIWLARAEGKVRALAVPSEVATALSVAEGKIALRLERVAFDTDDKPIEAVTAYYDLKNVYCRLTMRCACRARQERPRPGVLCKAHDNRLSDSVLFAAQ